MDSFKNRLRFLRVTHGLTQEKLAKDIEELFNYPIGKATISQYENGKREPSITMLINLAQYFNCSVDYIVGISDHLHIIESSEFSNKMSLLKNIVDAIPKMDYINAHDINKLLIEYLRENGMK